MKRGAVVVLFERRSRSPQGERGLKLVNRIDRLLQLAVAPRKGSVG